MSKYLNNNYKTALISVLEEYTYLWLQKIPDFRI